MLSLEEFKKTLPDASKYTDAQVKKMRDDLDKLADIIFEHWLRKHNAAKVMKQEIENFLTEEGGKPSTEIFVLKDKEKAAVRKYSFVFNPWTGAPIGDTYGGKAIIDHGGEALFAELAVLRLFQKHGWSGVWVDSYRRVFRDSLPEKGKPVSLPKKQSELIETLRTKTGRFGGCWDVLLWKDEMTLFVELKRKGKDRIRQSQVDWLDQSLQNGLSAEEFLIIEWNLAQSGEDIPPNEL